MYFALGAEAQMGLKGWPEVGDESLGAAIRAKDRGTRRAIGGQTKAFFKGFQSTTHKLSLCTPFRSLHTYLVQPVGRA